MTFLYPEFLYALFALVIPVIIHLFYFRRFKTVYFTNVRFLKNIQEETSVKNRLKHFLILLSRLLAIAFLVFAFAQPFIPFQDNVENTSRVISSIYIDNSFSMEAMDNDVQLLEKAKMKATEIVNAYETDDEFQLLTNDFEAKQQRLVNKEEMLEMIGAVQISPAIKPLEEIVKRQQSVLNKEKDKKKNIYLISDFQKTIGNFNPDSLFEYNLIPLKGKEQRNLTIDSVWFTTPVQMVNEQSALCYTIKNYGDADAENVNVQLTMNGQIKGIADITIASLSSVTDTLFFTLSDSSTQTCNLAIKDYPITFDDIFYFTFEPLKKIPVLILNGAAENIFLTSVYQSPLIQLQQNSVSQIDFNELKKFNFIILNELIDISSGLSDILHKRLEEGAIIFLIPALTQNNTSINSFLRNGVSFGNINAQKRTVSSLNTEGELFSDVFEKLPKNLSLPSAEKSFEIQSLNRSAEEILLPFSDGKPFLSKYQQYSSDDSPAGALYLSAVPFDRAITDFPVQGGIFVPCMFRLAISSISPLPLYSTIAQEQWIKIHASEINAEAPITVKGDGNEFIPAFRNRGNISEINLSNYAEIAGIYSITNTNSQQAIALNYNRKESYLSFYSTEELSQNYTDKHVSIIEKTEQNLSNLVAEREQSKSLWKYCVIFALLFLAIEMLLIRFMP